jgi:uncharacterized protein YjbI with pentapeptide repeats/adenylate kinase family enzyme
MTIDPGLSLKQPTPVSEKSLKINFRDFSKALGKGLVDLGFGHWDSLAKDGVEVLTTLGLGITAEEIAWLLVYRSLLQGMRNLIEERQELEPETFDAKALQTQLNVALKASSLSLDRDFFQHPDRSPILAEVKPTFAVWLRQGGVIEAEAVAMADRLPIYFAAALHQEWGKRSKDYGVLKESLDTPFTQANERIQAWARYGTWLQKQVEEPMFLEAFSLKRVYVPLRAYYNRKVEAQKAEELEVRSRGDKSVERVVVDLETTLETWLSAGNKQDAIRLISGGPGSGKSSFAKMFAAKLAEAQGDKFRVLFIPLHHFEPDADLVEAMGQFVRMEGILPHNPLEADHREARLLIIFDGLDELAMQGKIAERTAQEFMREVQRKVERFNQQEICLQVLIGGRELVVQANETDFRKEGQILHILPYFVPKKERESYVDAEKRLDEDHRQIWWKNYGAASGKGYEGLPSELDQGNLTEITAQPLLNYLVALSLQRGKLEFSTATNLNAIYNDLLTAIYERGWAGHQHRAIEGIQEQDFVRILEEIGLAAWHGNGRTTTVGEIERHCESSNLKVLLDRFQEGFKDDSKASITRLLTAFYFRQSGHDSRGEKTFEFTHKSFGEYLTARRIVKEIAFIHRKLANRYQDPYEDWDERKALHRWALVCGPSAMDEYLLGFVLDEMRLQYQQDPAIVAQWQQTFCDLISFMLHHGIPMELLNPRPNFQTENKQARNAEEALLVAVNSCARLTEQLSKFETPSQVSFGTWISRLQGQRLDASNVVALHCLSYLDLSGTFLPIRDLYQANLEGANLEGANLEGAHLEGANLEEAHLEGAHLEGAHLYRAHLYRAHLEGAHLEGAHLEGANLEWAHLEGAHLEWAHLERAHLEGTILENKVQVGSVLEPRLEQEQSQVSDDA